MTTPSIHARPWWRRCCHFIRALPLQALRASFCFVFCYIQFAACHISGKGFASRARSVNWLASFLDFSPRMASCCAYLSDVVHHRGFLDAIPKRGCRRRQRAQKLPEITFDAVASSPPSHCQQSDGNSFHHRRRSHLPVLLGELRASVTNEIKKLDHGFFFFRGKHGTTFHHGVPTAR